MREIKADPDLQRVPVIMFSATKNDEGFARCYHESAKACVRKHQDFESSLEVIREIERFWFHTAR
jgi:CheY-like chemotaxis protein